MQNNWIDLLLISKNESILSNDKLLLKALNSFCHGLKMKEYTKMMRKFQ